MALGMGDIRAQHDPVLAEDLEGLAQIFILLADHIDIPIAEDLARPGPRVAELWLIAKDALSHAPIGVHHMDEPRRPLDARLGKGEAEAREAFGHARTHNSQKAHEERSAVREGNGHVEILEEASEGWAFEADVNIDRHVQPFRLRPKRIEVAAVEEPVSGHAMDLCGRGAELSDPAQLFNGPWYVG